MDTGFPTADAEGAFTRQRRRQALARIAARLRSEPDDVSQTLPFEPVVSALGRRGERDLGVMPIPIGSVVGTVDRRPDTFDRSFRPRSPELRARWESIMAARKRGETMPPIDVFRVGKIHFVQDGHHRVSVARALGDTTIDAHVREVSTALPADPDLRLGDLSLKRHERMFHERVPLPRALRERISFSDEWRYAQLAALVESWGYRASHAREHLMTREEAALAWFREEYEPVVEVLNEVGGGGSGTEAERYLRIVMLRYLLLYTNEWSDEIVERLLGEVRAPSSEDDTMVHDILKEMK
ncbi:MAG TPA: hypothetical protein VN213_13115 [Solirubrobacteraceae bacterium]|nr:hypothetical protein [Solirubrobacteraceae bacterium]